MSEWLPRVGLILAVLLGLAAPAILLAEPSLESGTVVEAAGRLKAGEYLWAPEIAPAGPVLVIVNLATQRAVVYRNGLPIGISTVSTGRPGYRTPTGVFTILQKRVEHYSSLYDDAPMPYMQRLTWQGVALHAGNLPGYPASHGCIRLPHEFARLLYGVTQLGMTVIITDQQMVPRVAPTPGFVPRPASGLADATEWHPERSPRGPVSIVVSVADRRVIVIRNGVVIGTAPVEIDGPVDRTSAYVLRAATASDRDWLRIALPGQTLDPDAGPELRGRLHVA
ncbi:MAG: L,D-transpeptidase, partial [Allosphingosinicella sp.]